jgi:hypothetical protein
MQTQLAPEMRLRRVAAAAVLDAYREGRPIDELRHELPRELEATGQRAAAEIVRMFFQHPVFVRSALPAAVR